MPNQRHPDRKKFAAWMFEGDIKQLKAAAAKEGMSLPEFINLLVKEHKKLRREKETKNVSGQCNGQRMF